MGFLKGIGSSMEKLEGWFLAQSLCLSSCLHASRMHRLIADITSNQPLGYTLVKEDTASPLLSSLSDVLTSAFRIASGPDLMLLAMTFVCPKTFQSVLLPAVTEVGALKRK